MGDDRYKVSIEINGVPLGETDSAERFKKRTTAAAGVKKGLAAHAPTSLIDTSLESSSIEKGLEHRFELFELLIMLDNYGLEINAKPYTPAMPDRIKAKTVNAFLEAFILQQKNFNIQIANAFLRAVNYLRSYYGLSSLCSRGALTVKTESFAVCGYRDDDVESILGTAEKDGAVLIAYPKGVDAALSLVGQGKEVFAVSKRDIDIAAFQKEGIGCVLVDPAEYVEFANGHFTTIIIDISGFMDIVGLTNLLFRISKNKAINVTKVMVGIDCQTCEFTSEPSYKGSLSGEMIKASAVTAGLTLEGDIGSYIVLSK